MDFGKWLQKQGKTKSPIETPAVTTEVPETTAHKFDPIWHNEALHKVYKMYYDGSTADATAIKSPEKEGPPQDFNNRVGRFVLDVASTPAKHVMAIMSQCVILDATRYYDNSIEYIARSWWFDVHPQGAVPRTYTFEVQSYGGQYHVVGVV